MDTKQIKSFVDEIIYDVDTVQYLLDYGRFKETLPIIGKILEHINSFRAGSPGDGLKDAFLEINSYDSQYAHFKNASNDEDLSKLKYKEYVESLFIWTEKNVSKIKREIRSPFQKAAIKLSFYGGLFIIVFCILIISARLFFTRDWGLYGEFYKGMKYEEKISSGVSKTLNFDDYSEMNSVIPRIQFSVHWRGYLLVPQDLKYTFYLYIKDGGRLFIDDIPLIDKWQFRPGVEFEKETYLTKGKHAIRVDYFDGGDAALKLSWKPENGEKVVISERYLRVK